MAGLLLAAILMPLLPAIELPVAHAEEGGSTTINNYDYDYQQFFAGSHGELNVEHSDGTTITGTNQTISVESDSTQIIVQGDYYKETEQFNPKVGEVWSGNALPANKNALWVPKWSELPSWFTDNVLASEGYAALYTGFMETDNTYVNKPYGVTRVGEVLGYDIYASDGEDYINGLDGSDVLNAQASIGHLLTPDEYVTKDWAMMNIYRAIGVECYQLAVARLNKETHSEQIHAIVGDSKCTVAEDENGDKVYYFDVNRSPIVQFLSGNITSGYSGDSEPVVVVWASRTYYPNYLKQAEMDMLEYDLDMGLSTTTASQITCAEFCRWVAFLMEAYGEPVITEQEQYMLLEAYGRELPYDEVFPAELEAIKYLMVRGIIDGTDELRSMVGEGSGWSWSSPINFEQATTILMRVKDKGSRLTFKEFQLTTDLELLKRGYYPVDMPLVDMPGGIFINDVDYVSAAKNTHYDYLVRRTDNRALFLSADEVGGGSSVHIETDPHVAIGLDAVDSRLPNSYYRGRTRDGWYWFQVPIGYNGASDGQPYVFINSAHSSEDSPAQYKLPIGGGYFTVDTSAPDVDAYTAVRSAGFGDDVQYVDSGKFTKAARVATLGTADWLADKNRTTVFCLQVHKGLIEGAPDLKIDTLVWKDTVTGLPTYAAKEKFEEHTGQVVYVKAGTAQPKTTAQTPEDEWVKCALYKASSFSQNNEYWDLVVVAEKPITKTMAQAAFNLHDKSIREGFKGNSPVRTIRGYCRFGDDYLVSVEYLKSMGSVLQFLHYGQSKYYMSVKSSGGPDTDVYFDLTNEDAQIVMYGACAYIYNAETLVVNQMGDDYFVPVSVVTGKTTGNVGIQLPDGSAAICVKKPWSCTSATLISGGSESYKVPVVQQITKTGSYDDKLNGVFIDVTQSNIMANYVAVFDKRHGDAPPKVFTLYETGNVKAPDKRLEDRAAFEELFGWSIGSDTMHYYMVQGAPEVDIQSDGSLVPRDVDPHSKASQLRYSIDGALLIQVPVFVAGEKTLGTVPLGDSSYLAGGSPVSSLSVNAKTTDFSTLWDHLDDYIVPYAYVATYRGGTSGAAFNGGVFFSLLTNWDVSAGGTRKAVSVWYVPSFASGDKNPGLYKRDRSNAACIPGDYFNFEAAGTGLSEVTDGSIKYQVCGLPALLANFTVQKSKSTGDVSSILRGNPNTVVYFGCDKDASMYGGADLPFAGVFYVAHMSDTTVALQAYDGELKELWPSKSSGAEGQDLVAGKPNKINDWLMWLKHAKLSDAEDILTICIIAVLQWLPRIFMFIFFLLMGLSMIASMKPWVIFCDRYFDPYKFLTAGRMDVHTIDIKKVVLCSMIALILFGFFQNGLILDIIAWCARAVTGILNR